MAAKRATLIASQTLASKGAAYHQGRVVNRKGKWKTLQACRDFKCLNTAASIYWNVVGGGGGGGGIEKRKGRWDLNTLHVWHNYVCIYTCSA